MLLWNLAASENPVRMLGFSSPVPFGALEAARCYRCRAGSLRFSASVPLMRVTSAPPIAFMCTSSVKGPISALPRGGRNLASVMLRLPFIGRSWALMPTRSTSGA